MRFKGLDLNLLVALDVLLAECSITRASERMNLSQSAMSSALARLRDYFKDDLLIQAGRQMVPTPLAESLVKPVRSVLLMVDTTIRVRPEFDAASSERHFKLLMSDYVATVLFARLLPELQEAAPGITFELIPFMEAHWECLERGEVDFLIMPSHYARDGHPSKVLFDDEFVCVAWSENPLIGDALSVEQYLDLGHVAVRFGTPRTPSFDEWFMSTLGHRRRVEVVASDFGSMPRLVVGTSRIATVPRRLAGYYAQYMPLRMIPLPVEMPVLREVITWHRYRDPDPGSIWLRRSLARAVATES